MAFVYILRCADGTFYVGHTTDLTAREKAHNEGTAAAYTAKRLPVRVVYSEQHSSIDLAIARERQLKRWTAQKKEALIAGDTRKLHMLSRRRRY
jgi:predicted GIY-YIG superfamily endonuclease